MTETSTTYDASRYECPSVTVDVVIFTVLENELKVLLVKRKHWPYEGMWAIPGGFVEMDETLEQAAYRELREETGIGEENVYLEQLHTFGDPGRDPRMRVITIAYFAVAGAGGLRAGSDAADAGWFSAFAPPPLVFDHADILKCAIGRLRERMRRTAIAFPLLPEQFTLREMQTVYQSVFGQTSDQSRLTVELLRQRVIEIIGSHQGNGRGIIRICRFCDEAVAKVKAKLFSR